MRRTWERPHYQRRYRIVVIIPLELQLDLAFYIIFSICCSIKVIQFFKSFFLSQKSPDSFFVYMLGRPDEPRVSAQQAEAANTVQLVYITASYRYII